jgi:hypothetical protein
MSTPEAPGRLPVLPVARKVAAGHAEHAPAAGDHAAHATRGETAGSGAALPGRQPTLGFRPLRPSVAIQREPGDGAGSAGSPDAPTMAVAARWQPADDLPDVVGPSPATARGIAGRDDAVPLSPRHEAPPPTSPTGVPSRSGGAREMVFPPRDAGPSEAGGPVWTPPAVPAPGAGSVQRPPAATTLGGHAQGHAQHQGPRATAAAAVPAGSRPLTLARTVAPVHAAATPGPTPAAGPVTGRIVADPSQPSAPPTVQASTAGAAPGMTPIASITATPVVQRVDGAAQAPATTDTQRSDRELDELARALFGRIRTHLRAEVIHEREAKGLTFDAF